MDTVKALIAKAWKDEELDLDPGRHYFDEVLTVRLSGTVEKQADQLVAPTTSVPLILTLALFWEKAGSPGNTPSTCSGKRSPRP